MQGFVLGHSLSNRGLKLTALLSRAKIDILTIDCII